jgi:hypothetical protein
MNAPAKIGHNGPPDALEDLIAKWADTILEVENWLDGAPVENEGQMKAVDALLAAVKDAEGEAKDAKEAEYRPHKLACDAVVTRWKPVLDDFDRMKKGLAAAVTAFKNKLAAEKEAERRKAWEEAEAKRRAAEEAQRTADMADLDARRKADELAAEAREAERQAQAAKKDTVKGLRTYTIPEITDPKACINWIAQNDKPALLEFMTAYVERKTREGVRGIAGVEVRSEKRAV